MRLSREAKLVSGITLLAVPTIMYGGITLLGILTQGTSGLAPARLALDETQWALWRAGHAHAGVWVIDPIFGHADAHRRHEAVSAYDVVGSYQRTCSSGYCLGRLFWRGLFPCMPVAALCGWFKLVRCHHTHGCRVIEESTCACSPHLTPASTRTGFFAGAPARRS